MREEIYDRPDRKRDPQTGRLLVAPESGLYTLLRETVRKNKSEGFETFIFLHCAGHGITNQSGLSVMLLNRNSEDAQKLSISIQHYFSLLGSMDGAYVIAVLDMCRTFVSDTERTDLRDKL